MNRRALITGGLIVVAPAVIRTPGLLMRIKPWIVPVTFTFTAMPPGGYGPFKYLVCAGRVFEHVRDGQEGGAAEWKEIYSAEQWDIDFSDEPLPPISS